MFAYVVGILQRAGLTDLRSETSKYPILVAINLVKREVEATQVPLLLAPATKETASKSLK